jgi:hypothetical protein
MTSTQTIVVHHWHPAFSDKVETREAKVMPDSDAVWTPAYECSVPFTITVVESESGKFAVRGVQDHCPLCQRGFGAFDRKRITNAAIEQHLATTSFYDHSVIRKTADVVLDV